MARILVTGAVGFIGSALCPTLVARGHRVLAGVRRPGAARRADIELRLLGDITPARSWSTELADVEIVVHLAQRAHRGADTRILAGEPAAAALLARAAARQGARRFVYVSSIKAMGEVTQAGRAFRADDPPLPEDQYGRAKLATERALAAACAETGLELVTIRPPLVYGAGVGGNFRALVRLAASRVPLPFAAVDNRRSLIFVENLADLIAVAAVHPAASERVLLPRDATDLSTPALIRLLAAGQGRQPRLFAVPAAVWTVARRLPVVGSPLCRLTQSLQVDGAATCELLGWHPPFDTAAALTAAARRPAACVAPAATC